MFAPVEPPENFAKSGLERKGWARKKKWKRGSREDDLYFKVGKHVLDMSTKPNCPFLSSFRVFSFRFLDLVVCTQYKL